VTVTTERLYDTDIHIADIVLTSPDQLKTAFAEDTYGRNVKAATSEIAADHGALVAVNGDFYGSRTSGYVIRGGVLYRDRSAGADQEDLVVAADGTFRLVTEGDVSAADLLAEGAVHVFSFGPGLVDQGQVVVGPEDEVDKAMASNPRTALAQVGPLHYLFVVADGRTDANAGLSLAQLADVLVQLGAQTAYNLDGGGSSTLYYDGAVVNTPTTSGRHSGEREVSDIVYVTP
jgi:exopolysaccharide biosynthesis protein